MALRKKYKGNTLPEVMIALVITSFCATLSVLIYINIQQNTQPFIRMKANELAAKYLDSAIESKDYIDNSYPEEEYTVKKSSLRDEAFSDCYAVKVVVYDSRQKKISELQTMVYNGN
ncbi:MAG: type IV pilus modification PilV family protein [Bacteroidia bacterium]